MYLYKMAHTSWRAKMTVSWWKLNCRINVERNVSYERTFEALTFCYLRLYRCVVYNALLHQINIAVKSQIKVIKLQHGKKLHRLKLKQETTNYVDERKQSYIKHTVHNFSSYVMSNEEYTTLSFGLDHHILTKSKGRIQTVWSRLIEKLNRCTGQWVNMVKN